MKTPDTYLACAMTSMPTEEYEVFRHSLLSICDALRERGLTPYSEPYERSLNTPESPLVVIQKNKKVLDNVQQFVLVYAHKQSASALIELGYAWARSVPITVFAKEGVKLPYYLRHAETAAAFDIHITTFESIDEVPNMIKEFKFND